jgi:hypothetical protein
MGQQQTAIDLTPDVAALASDTLMRWRMGHTTTPDRTWARQVFDRWLVGKGLTLAEGERLWPEYADALEVAR